MASIKIYSTPVCPYCLMAKRLLNDKGAAYVDVDVSASSSLRETMRQRAGGRMSVPQIFINNRHIGGFDDLIALERADKLDRLLAEDD